MLELFFDGECPLCAKEVKLLRKLDRKQRIAFIDIADPAFVAADVGRTQNELMAEIHARKDGQWVIGADVFRDIYAAVGLGGLTTITKLPGIRQAVNGAYSLFAKNRLRLTGRSGACNREICEVPEPS